MLVFFPFSLLKCSQKSGKNHAKKKKRNQLVYVKSRFYSEAEWLNLVVGGCIFNAATVFNNQFSSKDLRYVALLQREEKMTEKMNQKFELH